ncbi:hypothetical protein FB45DRAFT_748326, partial [Roridomyces roridus]
IYIKDEGTLDWIIVQNPKDPRSWRIIERYESQASVKTHMSNPFFKTFGRSITPLVSKPLVVTPFNEVVYPVKVGRPLCIVGLTDLEAGKAMMTFKLLVEVSLLQYRRYVGLMSIAGINIFKSAFASWPRSSKEAKSWSLFTRITAWLSCRKQQYSLLSI